MKEHVQHIVDAKVVGSAAVSAGGASVSFVEQVNPYLEAGSFVIAMVAGLMAIVWTGIRIYDRYKGK